MIVALAVADANLISVLQSPTYIQSMLTLASEIIPYQLVSADTWSRLYHFRRPSFVSTCYSGEAT